MKWWLLLETFEEDFYEKWREEHNGARTPDAELIRLRRNCYQPGFTEINGKKIPCTRLVPLNDEDQKKREKELEAQADSYRLQKETYVAERVYAEIGWEEFLEQIEGSYFKNELKVLLDYFVPCGSADAQCNLFCPVYEVCKGNVQEMQEYKEKVITAFCEEDLGRRLRAQI